MAGDVRIDEAAVERLLNDLDGPVGALMYELSGQVVTVARARAHVRLAGEVRNPVTTDASPVGFMRGSIRTSVKNVASRGGKLYGGAGAAEDPTVFLEVPREDRVREPFLTTGLDSIWV